MPWKETDPMTERVQFMAAYLSHSVLHDRAVRALRHSPQYRLQVGAPLYRARTGGAPGEEPCPAPLPPPYVRGGGSGPVGSQTGSPALGSAQDPALPRAASARSCPAGAEHRRRAVPARGLKPSAHTPPWAPAPGSHPPPGRGPECRLDGGLQGPVPHRRWPLLLPLDGGRRLQPLSLQLLGAALDQARWRHAPSSRACSRSMACPRPFAPTTARRSPPRPSAA